MHTQTTNPDTLDTKRVRHHTLYGALVFLLGVASLVAIVVLTEALTLIIETIGLYEPHALSFSLLCLHLLFWLTFTVLGYVDGDSTGMRTWIAIYGIYSVTFSIILSVL